MPPGDREHRRSRDDKEPRSPGEKTVSVLGSLFTGVGKVVVGADGKRYTKTSGDVVLTDIPLPRRKQSRRRRSSRSPSGSRSPSRESNHRKYDDSREVHRPQREPAAPSRDPSVIAPASQPGRRSTTSGSRREHTSDSQRDPAAPSRDPSIIAPASQPGRRSHTSHSQRAYTPEPQRETFTPSRTPYLIPDRRSRTSGSQRYPTPSHASSQTPSISSSRKDRYTPHDDEEQSELSFIAETVVPSDSISGVGTDDSFSALGYEDALNRAELDHGDFPPHRHGSSVSRRTGSSVRSVETIGGRRLIEQAPARSSRGSQFSTNSMQSSTRPAPRQESHVSTNSKRSSTYTEPRHSSHVSAHSAHSAQQSAYAAPGPRSHGTGSVTTTSSRRGPVTVEPEEEGYVTSRNPSQVSSGPRFDESSDDDRPVKAGRRHGGRRRDHDDQGSYYSLK